MKESAIWSDDEKSEDECPILPARSEFEAKANENPKKKNYS